MKGRSRPRVVCGSVAALALVLGTAGRAAAQEPAPAFVARYDATGEGCPDEASYRTEARARLTGPAAEPRRVDVTLAPGGRGFVGTVSLREGDRVIGTRAVEASTCAEVASASLLLVALASPDAEPPAPDPGPPAASAAPSDRSTGAPPDAERTRLRPGIAASGLVMGGLGPVSPGAGARLTLALDRPSWLAPELRAGVDLLAGAEVSNALGTAERSLLAARVELCPARLIGGRVGASVCAAASLGEIRVAGRSVRDPKDEGRLFAAVGGLARGRLAIAGGLGLELGVGVLAPLERHRFYFVPDATLLRLEGAVLLAEGGLAWSIP